MNATDYEEQRDKSRRKEEVWEAYSKKIDELWGKPELNELFDETRRKIKEIG